MQSHPRLREALLRVKYNSLASDFPTAFKVVVWELMRTQTQLNKLEEKMDKQINKVKKDVEKNDNPKAKKDIGKLLKMDKKFDAKIDKCDKKMKKGR
jgi:hypothetical protein